MTWVAGALLLGAFLGSFSVRERADASTALPLAGAAASVLGRSSLGPVRSIDPIGDTERKPYDQPEIRSLADGDVAAIGLFPREASRAIDGFEQYRFHLLIPVGRPLRG